jgi:hypothetical protein
MWDKDTMLRSLCDERITGDSHCSKKLLPFPFMAKRLTVG